MMVEDGDDILLRYLLEMSDVCSSDLATPDALWDVLTGKDGSPTLRHSLKPLPSTTPQSLHLGTTLESSSLQEYSTGFESSRWIDILGQVRDVIRRDGLTAFGIHQSASQALILGYDHSSSPVNAPSKINFITLCVLLCCLALQLHSCQLSSIQKRPKRWQSLVWETLSLFRRNLRGVDAENQLTTVWIPLWAKYVVPYSYQLQMCLLATSGPSVTTNLISSLRKSDTAFVAAVVAMTTRLVRLCFCAAYEEDSMKVIKLNIRTLLQCMWDPLEGCYDVVLWCHPWRLSLSQPIAAGKDRTECFESLQSAILYWSVIRNDGDTMEIEEETISMLDTQWEPLGLAALAAVAWSHRPCVLSPIYCWRLWFPHVSILINDEDGRDDAIDLSDPGGRCGHRMHFRLLGFGLLQSLLLVIPQSSLARRDSRPRTLTHSVPVDPIGVLQLLSNRMVAASLEGGNRGKRVCRWAQQEVERLPTEGAAFQIMREVVARYQPSIQVTIVRDLVRDCLHPGLRPKLVDLLQPFVAWNDPSAIKSVWDFCDEALASLEKRLVSGMKGEGLNVLDFNELVEDSEFYTATISLLYRWTRVNKSLPSLPRVCTRISTVRSTLRATLELQTASMIQHARPSFRLHLLESMLDFTVDAMMMRREIKPRIGMII